MRITYDPQADAMMIYLRDSRVEAAHSREIVPAKLIIRFDEHENPISFELLYVSDYIDEISQMEFKGLPRKPITQEEVEAMEKMHEIIDGKWGGTDTWPTGF